MNKLQDDISIGLTLADALKHIKNGEIESAKIIIDNHLKSNKENDVSYFINSLILESENNIELAIENIEQAYKLNPENKDYLYKLTNLVIEGKQSNKAVEYLTEFLKNHPKDDTALRLLFNAYNELNDDRGRLVSLVKIMAISDLPVEHQLNLYSLFSRIQLVEFPDDIIQGLIKVLKLENIKARTLSSNLRNYILFKYKLLSKNINIDINDVISDQLLLLALKRVRLPSPQIEEFLTSLRATLLPLLLNKKCNIATLKLVESIAINNFENEYVHYINNNEQELLRQAQILLNRDSKNPNWTPKSSESILLLISMYKKLYELDIKDKLLTFNKDHWPILLHDIVDKSLFDIKKEISYVQRINSLTSIKNKTSKEVQDQYESNPYPRWTSISTPQLTSIGHTVVNETGVNPEHLAQDLFNSSTPILIAGGGTGEQPLSVASRLPHSKVTSIDLSKRSLAYSIIKAEELGIQNIEFYQADILDLPESLGSYSYIECCGVLHHMEDPILGWKRLLEKLEPGGVMRVALYSSIARTTITQERNKIKQLNMTATETNIRLYRQALLKKQPNSPLVNQFTDFYSLSECRDLIFHQHEKCYTWLEVEKMCEKLGLVFIGLMDNAEVNQAYKKVYPTDTRKNSFEKLHKLEIKYPNTFSSMYQFAVQKPL